MILHSPAPMNQYVSAIDVQRLRNHGQGAGFMLTY